MAVLARLIFRLDFPYSYRFRDSEGTAVKIMLDGMKDGWSHMGEDTVRHSIQGTKQTELSAFNLVFEVLTVNGMWDDLSGLDIRRVIESDTFRLYDEMVREYTQAFSVSTLNRAGLRLLCTEVVGWGDEKAARFAKFVAPPVVEIVGDKLGSPGNFGLFVSGKADDEVSYNLSFSPVAEAQIPICFSQMQVTAEHATAFPKNDLLFDIDLYETNFSFAEHSLARWSRTKIEKAANLIAGVRELAKQIGGG
jgi:hypothetical protein